MKINNLNANSNLSTFGVSREDQTADTKTTKNLINNVKEQVETTEAVNPRTGFKDRVTDSLPKPGTPDETGEDDLQAEFAKIFQGIDTDRDKQIGSNEIYYYFQNPANTDVSLEAMAMLDAENEWAEEYAEIASGKDMNGDGKVMKSRPQRGSPAVLYDPTSPNASKIKPKAS